jgi:hypothetical protein
LSAQLTAMVRGHKRTPDAGEVKWRPQGDSNPCYRRERAVS